MSESAKLAFSIDELAQCSGVGRTLIYDEINAGRLIVTKAGRRSLVLSDHARAWLEALPKFPLKSKSGG